MRPPSPAAAAFALLFGSSPLAAATIEGDVAYTPSLYGPGDSVVAAASIKPGPDERLTEITLRPGAGLPVLDGSADPEILGLEIERRGGEWRMRLRFVAWTPSEGVIKSFRAGDILLPGIAYKAAPRLGAEDIDPRPIRPQRPPPGAAGALYGLLAVVVVLGAALFGAAAYLVPAVRAVLGGWRAAQAYRRLDKTIGYLIQQASSADPAAYAAALAGALRNYLDSRVHPGIAALTSGEIESLGEADVLRPSIRDGAARLLAWSDRVRFGGESVEAAGLAEAAERVRRIAAESEEAIRARL
jgi:hypothetical protein